MNSIKKSCSKCEGCGLVEAEVALCDTCEGKKCIQCRESGFKSLPFEECANCYGSGLSQNATITRVSSSNSIRAN